MPIDRLETLLSCCDGAVPSVETLLKRAKAVGVPMRDARLGVGKRMGRSVWVHAAYRQRLGLPDLSAAERKIPNGFHWNMVKHDAGTGNISFIDYPDFDDVTEPTTGDSFVVRRDGQTKLVRGLADPWIMHHPWTTVEDDYEGFDVAAAMAWSVHWKSEFGIDATLSSRIGRKSVWMEELDARLGLRPAPASFGM